MEFYKDPTGEIYILDFLNGYYILNNVKTGYMSKTSTDKKLITLGLTKVKGHLEFKEEKCYLKSAKEIMNYLVDNGYEIDAHYCWKKNGEETFAPYYWEYCGKICPDDIKYKNKDWIFYK